MSPISHANALAKPLPHLPVGHVVHAVSTRDDIALPLRTAPLPSPPKPVMEVVEEEKTEEKDIIPPPAPSASQPLVLPPFSSPSDRQRKRRSQSSGDINFGVVSYSVPPQMLTLDPVTLDVIGGDASPKSKHRISIGVKPIDIEDWEDAIDYSWEYAADLGADEAGTTTITLPSRPSAVSISQENYLVVDQNPFDEGSSSASTPLMMQMPSRTAPDEQAPSSAVIGEEPSSPLLGLGIDSVQTIPNVSLDEMAGAAREEPEEPFLSSDVYHPQIMRSPVSTVSKSSSQESIIASIFGTQRSSNSSTSLSDFAHLTTNSFRGSVENLKLDFQDFSSASPVTEKHIREGSQDTIREDSHHTKSMEGLAAMGMIAPFVNCNSAPTIKHDRGASAPQVPVPERKSSIPAVDVSRTQTGRKRAMTGTSRPRRNTRVSYSLFPTPPPN